MSFPTWEYWDPESAARTFQGREITVVQPRKQAAPTTNYRHDYPAPELYWKHKPAPDGRIRPVPDFGHTSSHRDQFREWPLGLSGPVIPGYPERRSNPKLSAVTTSRASYVQPQLPQRMDYGPTRTHKPRNEPIGTTTMRADYPEWPLPAGHAMPSEQPGRNVPFMGTTTTRADYKQPAELPPPPAATANPPHVVPKFGGTTEYRAKYEEVPLPPGPFGAVGLQVASNAYKYGGVGGQFFQMIAGGNPAPQHASKTFTTTIDDQQTAAIVVVCKRSQMADGVVLGHFSLEGLIKAPVGVPKVEVMLKLTNEKTLNASATYIQGQKKKALTFTSAKRGPALRSVTNTDEVPH
eukprot:CAMPEP_0174719632 /NCGR_PEP_ID=MMETSP1094-20130205/31568_1 /TAXON_ID=156173 /ORGANISM="Chrysochromulina brevifilum, Strain UTEX LB 985" /LENGTH=350 /DNA_ID=CAMNT_0015919963 /DNA_START=30 /DNA_END=1082 /DNA_ORIENTATION=+